jgi:acyl-CoA reductase-like NAD-dependent aldehyde dehydrogenase
VGAPADPTTVRSTNPATGREAFAAPAADAAAVDAAVARARTAAPGWAARAPADRAGALRRFADLVERDAGRLAAGIVSEMGKLRAEADGEVEWTALSARWYADHPPRVDAAGSAVVEPRPLGVIAAITPWNVPLVTPAWKWLPALMAGNAVVWKPSELATGTAVAAAALLHEAGVPADVVHVVPGGPATARALAAHAGVDGIHFTGSTAAGRALARTAADRFARVALELGGANAAVVFADADVDRAASDIVAAATAINGQKCTATRRVLVQETVEDALLEAIAGRIAALRLGDPADPTTTLGPLVHAGARRAAEAAVERSLALGATLAGRAPADLPGGVSPDCFFPAAVLSRPADEDPLRVDELFAPVLTVAPFADADEAWRLAGAGPFGLGAAVFTADDDTWEAARRALRTGILSRNRRGDAVDLEAPFAGVRASGNGWPEGGEYAYASVTELRAVYGDR